MIFRGFVFLIIMALIELYAFQAVKTGIKTRWILLAYIIISIVTQLFIFYQFTQFNRSVGQTQMTMLTLGLLLLVLIPKLIVTFFMILEDSVRLFLGARNYFATYDKEATFLPERRRFVSQVALGIASIPFLSLIYGMTVGKYNFKVIKQTLFFPDLPESFDGFQITQISDIHSGSFDNRDKINYAIDLINAQSSDVLLFTGDIVNTHATEMHPWIETFKKIKNHEYGKFSVLGNHDYGEYIEWPSQEAKNKNFESIKDLHRQIDFKLLLNENTKIKKGSAEITLVGVENWGVKFKKAGDLNKASENVDKEDFKILMSHDPSHWEAQVIPEFPQVDLMLSGHTHGMQFGLENPYFKWSPVQWVYKQWAGLYQQGDQKLYVNRGFGFLGYPGRVGIMPEITLLELV